MAQELALNHQRRTRHLLTLLLAALLLRRAGALEAANAAAPVGPAPSRSTAQPLRAIALGSTQVQSAAAGSTTGHNAEDFDTGPPPPCSCHRSALLRPWCRPT